MPVTDPVLKARYTEFIYNEVTDEELLEIAPHLVWMIQNQDIVMRILEAKEELDKCPSQTTSQLVRESETPRDSISEDVKIEKKLSKRRSRKSMAASKQKEDPDDILSLVMEQNRLTDELSMRLAPKSEKPVDLTSAQICKDRIALPEKPTSILCKGQIPSKKVRKMIGSKSPSLRRASKSPTPRRSSMSLRKRNRN